MIYTNSYGNILNVGGIIIQLIQKNEQIIF